MLIKGNQHTDDRGVITFNNEFDASQIKRIYTIENHSTEFIRGWQGHKIEQRWFACVKGSFEISIIQVDDFDFPSKGLSVSIYRLDDNALTYLHIPSGFVTAIQSKEEKSKLLVMSDYGMGDTNDEYRYSLDYFINK